MEVFSLTQISSSSKLILDEKSLDFKKELGTLHAKVIYVIFYFLIYFDCFTMLQVKDN